MTKLSVSPDSIRSDPNNPNWTIPRTYGVWELSANINSKRYRYGNYPVRGKELEQEFIKAKLVALYASRNHAKEHADELNQ